MNTATILNVDDDEAGRFAITQILRQAGFRVEEAATGTEALSKAQQLPDLVLLDIRLPDMDGMEVCRRIKADPHTSGIIVVHLSASRIAPSDRAEGLEGGADGYLVEPVNQHELIATVRAFLRIRRMEASQRFLAHTSRVLSGALAANDMLSKLASLAVPMLGDLCLVDTVDARGNSVPVALATSNGVALDASAIAAQFPSDATRRPGVARVIASGVSERGVAPADPAWVDAQLGVAASTFMPAGAVASYLCVPLIARTRTLGALTLLSYAGREHAESELALAEDLAERSALLVDNARLYEEARKAIRTRENFLAVVSHDLKNPLGNISMNALLMLKEAPNDDKSWRLRGQVESIQRAAARMNHLIHDLLDLASLDAGALSMTLRRVPPLALIEEILEMLEPLAAEKQARLVSDVAKDLPDVPCDRERVLQVLSNLLGNALKFTPIRGTISVTAALDASEPSMVRFTVIDGGPGISEAELPHIFDRFWQAAETARFGTGLGLSIAKGIIESHRGRIGVETALGKGCAFWFTLPLRA